MQKARNFSSRALLLAVLCLAAFWSSARVHAGDARLKEISSDPSALRSAQAAGRKASSFCVNCHGANGVSKLLDVPNLAGQNPDYLLEQTRKFGKGERKDPFMQGLIKALQEEEKIQISLFYASQNPQPGTPDPAKVAQGKVVFLKYCHRCHGERARGDELIPRLAGQHEEYIVVAVTRYRDRTGERQDPQMSSAVAPLKNNEIKLVAAYLNSLP
ncbi:MAG: cytochrome c4 [Zoogloeaceae bacterium]|jgi:cytochrome c553|nr:cytochrome c4 [Zoogloeaceae bacterium]